ncbi:sterol desaturase family protein [Gloeothece verrucosa]|uniref:Fatty acid hydroxylase n=1 Tax=Gloeothece verrucosa (strain PCC 7822) TaxID=497965 RepID=E0UEK5_GLOV7|nr:sterol desaturase family protein [Gloeothece verrucosa]ADN16573.1 fatty acid hydroxylase [Gloeothece verrucosa PCC 7822]
MHHFIASLVLDLLRLSVWLVLLMLIFVPLERLSPRHKQKVFRREFLIDLLYYFLNSIVPKLLLVLPLSILAWTVHRLEPIGFYTWVASLPVGTRLLLAIIVGEFGAYWGHRWMHEIPLLWRFHAIHHSAKEMDWLVNTRAHPLDMFLTRLCGLVPIYLLGLAQPTGKTADIVPLLYVVFGTIWSFFIHANMCWRFGFLEKLIVTPAFHHWHHTNDGAEYIDKNYAAIFPWVDQIFGTFYLPKNRWPKKYGIDMPVASEITGQLLQPLENILFFRQQ